MGPDKVVEVEEQGFEVVNFWRRDGKPCVPSSLERALESELNVAEWAKKPRVVFVDYPRPTYTDAQRPGQVVLTKELRKLTWEMCFVPEVIHVESPGVDKVTKSRQTKRAHGWRATAYGRCSACGRLVNVTVPLASEDLSLVEEIDWVQHLVENENDPEVVSDMGIGNHHEGHLLKPEHLDKFVKYAGALSSVLGLLGPGLASRHGGYYPNRSPAHFVVSGKDWVSPVGVEAAALPTKENVAVSIGRPELLLVAASQLVSHSSCRIRDPSEPKVWLELTPDAVETLHLGLVFWSPTVVKGGGSEHSDPRTRYTRYNVAFETVDEYHRLVVGEGPSERCGLYPERCAFADLETRGEEVEKASGSGDKDTLIRPKDRVLNMFPPGEQLSWWLVVEAELKPNTVLSRRLRGYIPLICKQQIVDPTWVEGDEWFAEFWAMRASQRLVKSSVEEAFKAVERRMQ